MDIQKLLDVLPDDLKKEFLERIAVQTPGFLDASIELLASVNYDIKLVIHPYWNGSCDSEHTKFIQERIIEDINKRSEWLEEQIRKTLVISNLKQIDVLNEIVERAKTERWMTDNEQR